MPRPRRPYSEISDPTMAAEEYLGIGGLKGTSRRSGRWKVSRGWSYRTPNGVEDPFTYMLVLDTLMRMDDQIELRANKMVKWLDFVAPQLSWDAITVGRVLSDLADTLQMLPNEDQPFLVGGRDYLGRFYRLFPTPANQELLWNLRDDLQRLSEIEMIVRGRGDKTNFMGSPLLECPSARSLFVSPLREDEDAT